MAKSKVNKTEVGRIGNALVVKFQGEDEQGTVCLALDGEKEAGKAKAPTRYFSKKLALIALANTDKLRMFVADPRFDEKPVAPAAPNVVPMDMAAELAALRATVAQLTSKASGRLNPAAA